MAGAVAEGRRIVFCDEAIYTTCTTQKAEWSPKRFHYGVKKCSSKHQWVYQVIAGFAELGLEASVVSLKPISSRIFCEILPKIEANGGTFALFGDNVSYHKSKESERLY